MHTRARCLLRKIVTSYIDGDQLIFPFCDIEGGNFFGTCLVFAVVIHSVYVVRERLRRVYNTARPGTMKNL